MLENSQDHYVAYNLSSVHHKMHAYLQNHTITFVTDNSSKDGVGHTSASSFGSADTRQDLVVDAFAQPAFQ